MCDNQQTVSDKLWALRDIAEGLNNSEIDINHGIKITIPAIQRGKVWNAVRCEILWDSILRGIPIGTFSVSPIGEREFLLLDGQQRANAISLGYQDNTEKSESILWLDIGRLATEDIEQTDGNTKSDRKYFFMVTTKSQPWGYNLSDNETSNKLLSTKEKKEAIRSIGWSRSKQQDRPSPYELWPYKAKCPIPFSILRAYFENNADDVSFNDFICYCLGLFGSKEPNWLKKVKGYENSTETAQIWKCIKKGIINNLKTTKVLVQVITNLSDHETSIFFRRMNKSGVVPSDEEIRYSMLKSRIPQLKKLDRLAERHMPPAVLADIALSSFFVQKDQEWCSGVTYQKVNKMLAGEDKKAFADYILITDNRNGFEKSIQRLRMLLSSSMIDEDDLYLPEFLISSLSKKQNRDLYRLLLYIVQKWKDSIDNADDIVRWRHNIVALVTLVCWFKAKNTMIHDGFMCYLNSKIPSMHEWEQCTKRWLFESVQKGFLIPPPPLDVYDRIKRSREADSFIRNQENPAYREGINVTWAWDSEYGQALLLFVCRKYIKNEFLGYNPSDAAWAEENRPWDYDHIIPQSWRISGNGRRQGDFNGLVKKYILSTGNIAPIPFDKNREKHDDPPGEYLGDKNDSVLVNQNNYTRFQKPTNNNSSSFMEYTQETAEQFSRVVAERFYKIYDLWYRILWIDSFFCYLDKRRMLFCAIRQRLSNELYVDSIESSTFQICILFTCNGLQYDCLCNADWARPALSIGVVLKKEKDVFPAITAYYNLIQIGLRRHPSQNSIDGNNIMWKDNCYEECPYGKYTINELTQRIKDNLNKLLLTS